MILTYKILIIKNLYLTANKMLIDLNLLKIQYLLKEKDQLFNFT